MTTTYQMVFNETFTTIDLETYGAYSQLVRSLEAALKAAGYNITATELAGDQHNHGVGAIGLTDLAAIANHFISWVHLGDNNPQPQSWQDRQDAAAAYRLYTLREPPTLPAATLQEWNRQIRAARLKAGIKNRQSSKYHNFINNAAQPETCQKILAASQRLLDHQAQQLTQLVRDMQVDLQRKIQPVQRGAAHLRRTAHIIDALCLVSGVSDSKHKADALRAKAAQLELTAERLQQEIDDLNHQYHQDTADIVLAAEIIGRSLRMAPHCDKFKDLANLWAACGQAAGIATNPAEALTNFGKGEPHPR